MSTADGNQPIVHPRSPIPEAPGANYRRVVLVGDTVGKPGMRIACLAADWFREQLNADCLLINAENAADGSGLRQADYRRLIQAGYNGITLGDHIYKRQEIVQTLESEPNIVRPCNFPATSAGKSHMLLNLERGGQVAVISALGRAFMKPVDCPFTSVDRELQQLPKAATIRIVDFHAEATSDKQLMGRYLDGRVTAVLGTHTHVTTADEQIFPGGTGFQCDVGMTGPFDSIIGRSIDAVQAVTLTAMPAPFHVAKGDVRLSATWLDVDPTSGQCQAIGRISLKLNDLEDYAKSRESDVRKTRPISAVRARRTAGQAEPE
ncbi:MAG: YmdB family metallophosphoesterase [Pirellulaceae bacterium]|nr:YmdB family metallophosphoesterase [Pirellulaceae bacterium]